MHHNDELIRIAKPLKKYPLKFFPLKFDKESSLMSRPEELTDPKKFDEIMERINTKLAISAIPLRERALMSQALLGDDLDYDIADDDSVYPLTLEWYRKRFPNEKI
jgi:hypothetical protein